jgi:hypothetical protein
MFKNAKSVKMEEQAPKLISWLKRIGWAGFFFFLIKGLVWVAIFCGAKEFFK